jgi:tyrosyl-tRNA synthetase
MLALEDQLLNVSKPGWLWEARTRSLVLQLEAFHNQTDWTSKEYPSKWADNLRNVLEWERRLDRAPQPQGQPEGQVVLTTPLLEGLDGVNKMSKSLSNAIGIHEPPLEMYGKIMSISDAMMWHYYELLTDVQLSELGKMKNSVGSGVLHPMQAKKDLARLIVTDFHSPEAANQAADDWAKQFQKDEVPESAPRVEVRFEKVAASEDSQVEVRLDKIAVTGGAEEFQQQGSTHFSLWQTQLEQDATLDLQKIKAVRLDKLIFESGFVSSRTEATRKIREHAVRVMNKVVPVPIISLIVPCEVPTTLGRQTKIVSIVE